jgi:Putative Ig domain
MRFAALVLVAIAFAVLPVGCGGGGSSTSPPPPPPPPAALTITTPSVLPPAVQGSPYSAAFNATGGSPPYTWSTQLLGIPGMTLTSDGVLSGSPQGGGFSYISTITVTDSKGASASKSIQLEVIIPLSFSMASALPDINIALPAYIYISVAGGQQPYTFTLGQGSSMPPGLTFTNANGVGLIQGTPTTPGTYSFTVQVTDTFTPPFHISQTFTLNILNGLVVPNTSLPDAVQNLAYNEQIKVAGGTPPYHFVLFPNSSMPPGLTLNTNTGIVSGTPITTTQYTDFLYMNITDSAPTPATLQSAVISLNVQPQLAFETTSLPDYARGLNYGGSVKIVGGRSPYTLQVSSGTLPDGLSISPDSYGDFNLAGVPSKDGLFQFTLKATDSYETPNTASKNFQVHISDQMMLSGPNNAEILYNQTYSATFPITGGLPPYTWQMTTVPPGFTFDTTTGTLSSTSNPGSSPSSAIITAHDSSNPPLTSNYVTFSITVIPKLEITTSSLPTIATGSTTWLGLVAVVGLPNQWSISSGALPPGMNLSVINGNVTISGTPSQAGSYAFTLAISDSNPGSLHQSTSRQLTLTVKDRGQMTRNDTIATATPLSNLSLLASISPYSDASTLGPDVDFYALSAAPGSIVQVYVSPNNDFIQPPEPNSFRPVLEIVDGNGNRYQTCGYYGLLPNQVNNLPCVNKLPGVQYLSSNYYAFQVPGSGTTPVNFFARVSDERGDARPDFIYTFGVYGVN